MTVKILRTFDRFGLRFIITIDPYNPDVYRVSYSNKKKLATNFASVDGAEIGGNMLLDHYGESRAKQLKDES